MKIKTMFLIGILTFSFLALSFDNVNAVTLNIQSQGWTQNNCGHGQIIIKDHKNKELQTININPGETVDIYLTSNMKEIKFKSVGIAKAFSTKLVLNDLYKSTTVTQDQLKIAVWFYTTFTWQNEITSNDGVWYLALDSFDVSQWFNKDKANDYMKWSSEYSRWQI